MSSGRPLSRLSFLALAVCLLLACRKTPDAAVHPRVLVFGIDGADYELTLKMFDEGLLPNLASMREAGAFGPLPSIPPMLSPALWTTVATGKNRAKHGIFGFTAGESNEGEQELHSSRMLQVRRVWDIAGDAGWTVGVLNWWVTWPATRVNGYLVSNMWPTSENMVDELKRKHRRLPADLPLVQAYTTSTYPPELLAEIERFVVHDADISAEELANLKLSRKGYEYIWDFPEMKSRTAAGLHLYKTRQPDLCLVYYWILDHVSHQYFASDQEPVRRVYQMLDEILGKYRDLAGPDTLTVVLSDHGFEKFDTPDGPKADHGIKGVLFMAGPGVRPGASFRAPSLTDVTPTLLAWMGLPIASDMDGRVLEEVLEPGYLRKHPVQRIPTYETGPLPEVPETAQNPFQEGMSERLKALGYLK
jgi:predicted AlkP superfamily phosphohydrolase/phosphomutase